MSKRKTKYGSSHPLKSIKQKQMQATNTAQSRCECCCWNRSLGSGGCFNLCLHTGALAAGAAVSCWSQTWGQQPLAEAGEIEKKEGKKSLGIQRNTLVSPEPSKTDGCRNCVGEIGGGFMQRNCSLFLSSLAFCPPQPTQLKICTINETDQ